MDRATSVEYASEQDDVPNADEISCNLDKVFEYLSSGLIGEDDVDLVAYLNAYKELYNFFVLLGGAFTFVSSDVKTKIKILEDLREPKPAEFASISSMMSYEMGNNMLTNQKYVSGSRTLLRLHRGLDFLRKFLAEVHRIDDNDKTGVVCREVYDITLGNFHPWAIRKAAHIAMRLLPTRKELLKRLAKGDAAVAKKMTDTLPDTLKLISEAYQRTDQLYTTNKLHDLS